MSHDFVPKWEFMLLFIVDVFGFLFFFDRSEQLNSSQRSCFDASILPTVCCDSSAETLPPESSTLIVAHTPMAPFR